MSVHKAWRALLGGLLACGAAAVLTGAAYAQNLDRGKSPARLFADSCATCHRSARGLAKGRFSLTLYWFLKEHYASNSESAWALTAYLQSVDGGSRRSHAAAKPSHSAAPPRPALRPPMPVPGR